MPRTGSRTPNKISKPNFVSSPSTRTPLKGRKSPKRRLVNRNSKNPILMALESFHELRSLNDRSKDDHLLVDHSVSSREDPLDQSALHLIQCIQEAITIQLDILCKTNLIESNSCPTQQQQKDGKNI